MYSLSLGMMQAPACLCYGRQFWLNDATSVLEPSLARLQFEIDDVKGPVLEQTIRTMEQVKQLHAIDFSKVDFVGR